MSNFIDYICDNYNLNEIAINIKYNPDIHIVKNTYVY